jgi:XTP/dITP diphosphohydrolase
MSDEKPKSIDDTRKPTYAQQGSCSSLITRHSSLFLASSNPGKLREFREAAAARGVTVESLPGFAEMTPCVEDGITFEENARKKAIHYSHMAPGWVFADDSGLCVDALVGAPGVYSARFAGPDATDDQNNARLLAEIHRLESGPSGVPVSSESALRQQHQSTVNRTAHYICVIVLAVSGRVLTVVHGRADGQIIDEPRGTGGFGYDPYFLYSPLGKTFAEILPEEKFAVSHRGEAFRKLLDFICAGGMVTADDRKR